jgi:lysophospholipase L1-like esterase
MLKNFWVIVPAGILLLIAIVALVEILVILNNGTPVPSPTIPRTPQVFGTGTPKTYLVMGDSTAVSQGSAYTDGFAVASANHLAKQYKVTLVNVAVSGARVADVARLQLPQAAKYHPDIVLLAAGANDATHFTGGGSIRASLETIIDGLRKVNPNVKIVVTGSPAMDSVNRFPFGAKQLMGLRTRQVNAVFAKAVSEDGLTWAPIARETRAAFLADPTLLAPDKFHPNARGYALWTPVVNKAIDASLE